MSHIFDIPKPLMPGNSFCISFESVSTTDFPQPKVVCCSVMRFPISLYSAIISLLTAFSASYGADMIRVVIPSRKSVYSADRKIYRRKGEEYLILLLILYSYQGYPSFDCCGDIKIGELLDIWKSTDFYLITS